MNERNKIESESGIWFDHPFDKRVSIIHKPKSLQPENFKQRVRPFYNNFNPFRYFYKNKILFKIRLKLIKRICSTFDNRPEEQRHRRRNIEISHRTKYETKDLTSEFDPIRVTQSLSHESFDKKIGEKLIEGQNVRY